MTGERKTPEPLPATLAGLVDLRAGTPGDAVVFPGERAGYREFADASIDMARRLHGAGVRKGDRVGLLLQASLDAFALQLGAMRLGAIPVPINARFKARELRYVIGHSGMKILITDPAYADAARGGRRRGDLPGRGRHGRREVRRRTPPPSIPRPSPPRRPRSAGTTTG